MGKKFVSKNSIRLDLIGKILETSAFKGRSIILSPFFSSPPSPPTRRATTEKLHRSSVLSVSQITWITFSKWIRSTIGTINNQSNHPAYRIFKNDKITRVFRSNVREIERIISNARVAITRSHLKLGKETWWSENFEEEYIYLLEGVEKRWAPPFIRARRIGERGG